MTTNARAPRADSGHWYDRNGVPKYEVLSKNGTMRPTTLRDAKANEWLPSVTTILKTLNKPQLNDWLSEQACLAVLTSPRHDGEALDAFVHRVLHDERQQDEQASTARQLGTDIHAAIEEALNCRPYTHETFVGPTLTAISPFGRVVATEKVLVGDGCAGKTDAILDDDRMITVVDFKTTSKIPSKPYWEHELQVGFYCSALGNTGEKRVRGLVCYISTAEPGMVAALPVPDWARAYTAFSHLLDYWSIANSFNPRLP